MDPRPVPGILALLMACSLVGEAFHEAAGTLMLALFILHHRLNRGWWRGLFRGKYSPQRVLQAAVPGLSVPAPSLCLF